MNANGLVVEDNISVLTNMLGFLFSFLAISLAAGESSINFLAVGDWGGLKNFIS